MGRRRRVRRARTAALLQFKDGDLHGVRGQDVGRLVEDFILQGGVDTEFIRWVPYNGVGRTVRNGLNFTERGFGLRGAVGTSDRGHTAASQLKPGDFDWDRMFGQLGARWLHTGGIFAALSDSTPAVVIEAVQAARKHGAIVSYDLNYRPSLWKASAARNAREVNRRLPSTDVYGNEEDFTVPGYEVDGADENISKIDVTAFKKMIQQAVKNFKFQSRRHDLARGSGGMTGRDGWAGGKFFAAPNREDPVNWIGWGRRQFRQRFDLWFMTFNDAQRRSNRRGARRWR